MKDNLKMLGDGIKTLAIHDNTGDVRIESDGTLYAGPVGMDAEGFSAAETQSLIDSGWAFDEDRRRWCWLPQ